VARSWNSRLRLIPTVSATCSQGTSPSCCLRRRSAAARSSAFRVLAQYVLHELLDESLLVADLPDDGRDGGETSQLGGPPASLAVDDDVPVARRVVPHRDRLEHALLADGGGQFFQALRIEGTARLIRVRLDAVERDLACLGEFAGTACLG
jgi:hypothetical protein